MDLHPYETERQTLHVTTVVMLVCMASYMRVNYEHASHAFKVNVHS